VSRNAVSPAAKPERMKKREGVARVDAGVAAAVEAVAPTIDGD
jgi:hypothetical protein